MNEYEVEYIPTTYIEADINYPDDADLSAAVDAGTPWALVKWEEFKPGKHSAERVGFFATEREAQAARAEVEKADE